MKSEFEQRNMEGEDTCASDNDTIYFDFSLRSRYIRLIQAHSGSSEPSTWTFEVQVSSSDTPSDTASQQQPPRSPHWAYWQSSDEYITSFWIFIYLRIPSSLPCSFSAQLSLGGRPDSEELEQHPSSCSLNFSHRKPLRDQAYWAWGYTVQKWELSEVFRCSLGGQGHCTAK